MSRVIDIAPLRLRRHLAHLSAQLEVLIDRRAAGKLHPRLGKRTLRALLDELVQARRRHERLYGEGADEHRLRFATDEIAVHIEIALEAQDREDFLAALDDARRWSDRGADDQPLMFSR